LDKIQESEGVYLEEPIHPKEIGLTHVDLVDLKKRVRCRTGKETITTRHICPPEHLVGTTRNCRRCGESTENAATAWTT
jgi:hypothetical protein